jgi:hypothetical protein
MIESAIIGALAGDHFLVSRLSTYLSSPAVFSEMAPETATLPFVVVNITTNTEDSCIHTFNVMVDVYNNSTSLSIVRVIIERIEYLLDNATLDNERYDTIRLRYFSSGSVPDDSDLREIHYNIQFTARAGRKQWMDTILN